MACRAGYIPRMLLATLAALAAAGAAPANGLDCSSPPSGFGGSWFRSYQDWCRQCGGTPSATANPPTCTPGPNWGGRGTAVQGNGSVDALASGIQKMFEDYARGTEEEKRRMMGIMDRESREKILLEAEQARAAAERARMEDERRRTGALEGLKGIPGGELGFRSPVGGPAPGGDLRQKEVVPPAGRPAAQLEGSTPLLLRDTEPRGHRIVDCDRAAQTRERLASGLPVQREAIEKTRAQVESARADVLGASAETREVLIDAAKKESLSLAKEVVTSTKAFRMRIAALKDQGIPIGKRRLWLESLDTVSGSAEALEKLSGAGQAGYAAGTGFRENARKLSGDLVRLNRLFVESGIAEEIGESLSEYAGGPLGALAFRAAKLSIDVGVAQARGTIGEEEYRGALENLETMRTQYNRAEDAIRVLDADIAQFCRSGDYASHPAPSPPAGR